MFFSTMAPETSLVILVFFISLVDEKLLFFTKCISKKSVSKFIFFKVFILFFGCFVVLEIFGINLSNARRQLLTFSLMMFSTISSQVSSSQPWASNQAKMKGQKLFWKYQIKIFLLRAVTKLNYFKTTCKYFKYKVQLKTFFN